MTPALVPLLDWVSRINTLWTVLSVVAGLLVSLWAWVMHLPGPAIAVLGMAAVVIVMLGVVFVPRGLEEIRERILPGHLRPLDIVFHHHDPYVTTEHPFRQPRYPRTLTSYRVGVVNRRSAAIENVRVALTEIEPAVNAFTPGELRFRHDASEDGLLSRNGVTLYPTRSPAYFVNVVQMEESAPGEDDIEIFFVGAGGPRNLRPGRYTITLRAEGKDVAACSRRFTIDVDIRPPWMEWLGDLRARVLRFWPE
jgi:xanthosine utilization system XapX-like protein